LFKVPVTTLQKHVQNTVQQNFQTDKSVLRIRFAGLRSFCRKRGLKHSWRNTKVAGKDCFAAFLKRNRDISLRIPEGLSKVGAEKMNRKAMEVFFLLTKKLHKN
jgi:hypothetical protein